MMMSNPRCNTPPSLSLSLFLSPKHACQQHCPCLQCSSSAIRTHVCYVCFAAAGSFAYHCCAGFYVVYSFSSFEAFNLDQALHRQEGAQQWMRQSSGLLNAQHTRHILSHPAAGSPVGTNLDAAAGVTEITAAAGAAGRTADETPQHGGEDRKHAPRDSNPAATQKYWLSRTWATAGGKSLENTVPPCLGGSGSSSCQRAHADGAAAAAVARRLQWLHRDVRTHPHSGTDSARNASIGNSNARSTGGYGSSSGSTRRRLSSRDGDAALSSWQRLLRGAFYVWVSLMNLVGISSLWARCADAFPPEVGSRAVSGCAISSHAVTSCAVSSCAVAACSVLVYSVLQCT